MKKFAIALISILTIAAIATAALTAQPGQKVRIGFSTMSATSAPLWIAQDEGFCAKNGINSELVFIPGPSIAIAARLTIEERRHLS